MSRIGHGGWLRRCIIIGLVLPVYTFLVMVALTWAFIILAIDDWPISSRNFPPVEDWLFAWEWWAWMGAIGGAFVISQAVFLIPIARRRPPRSEHGKSLFVSMAIAGAIGAGLTVGLLISTMTFAHEVLSIDTGEIGEMIWAALALILLASWFFWSGLLFVYVRGIWAERMLGRIVALAFAGTVIELLCILPLDVMIRRKTYCYCYSGTLFNLTFGVGALLWLAGPGIVIALVWRRRRMWREQFCDSCGYEKGPSPGEKCPECGLHGYAHREQPSAGRPRFGAKAT